MSSLDVAPARTTLITIAELEEAAARIAPVAVRTPLLPVWGNLSALKQIIANLLTNALKFVPADTVPQVRLHTERVGENVRLWVEDNGIGIAPEHKEKSFGLFERLHNNASYPGTGVCLAIVRKAVERMDGRVCLLSKPGEGSRFWLELTAFAANESPPAQPALASSIA